MKKIILLFCIVSMACKTTAQTKQPGKKLTLTNVKNGIVYYDEQPEFIKNKWYTLELDFSNPITKIEKKEPISLKIDGVLCSDYKTMDYEIVSYENQKYFNRYLVFDTVIAITYWDSTHQSEDVKHPGYMITDPILMYYRIDENNENAKNIQLHIAEGTFIDTFGNKNEEINITYIKRKK